MKIHSKTCILAALIGAAFVALPYAQGEYWTEDAAFTPAIEGDPGIGGAIYASPSPGGKLLLNTSFDIVSGKIIRGALVRLNGDGTVDPTFNGPSATSILTVYSDGRVLIGTHPQSGTTAFLIQRLLADGSPDPSFSSVLLNYDSVTAALLGDERILIYGQFTTVEAVNLSCVALLGSNGGVDNSFQSPFPANPGNAVINFARPTADGQHIIIAGGLLNLGTGLNYIACLNLDGSIDPGFSAAGASFSGQYLRRIYPNADGGVLVVDGVGNISRLTSSGSVDGGFTPALVGSDWNFGAQQVDGKIFYTALGFLGGNTQMRQLRRMNLNGSDDSSFPVIVTPYSSSYEIGLPTLSSDGTIFVGPMTAERHAGRLELTHVLANGSIDPDFNPRFSRFMRVDAFAVQPDGKYLLAGRFDHINNIPVAQAYSLIRLNVDGSLDSSFNATLPLLTGVGLIVIQPGGKLLVGFSSGSFGGISSFIRIATDGGNDATFQPIPEALYAVGVDSAGYIYGSSASNAQMVRYTPDGALDSTFLAPSLGIPRIASPLSDGALLVVSSPNLSMYSFTIKRLLHNGAIDASFTSPQLTKVVSLAALPDGTAMIGEESYGGQPVGSYYHTSRRLLPDGTSNYSYASKVTNGTGARQDIRLAMAGALFDLLRAAAPGSNASISADFLQSEEQMSLSCRTDGQLMMQSTSQYDLSFRRYQRTALTSPSMDAGPFFLNNPPPTAKSPLNNAFFHLNVTPGGLAPFNYQWLKDGIDIPGQTTLSLSLPPLQAGDAGVYAVRVSNAFGSVTGANCTLTIDTAHSCAAIVTQPSSQAAARGSTASFSVVAMGDLPLSYQWTHDGVPMPGATTSSLVLSNVQPASSGNYAVQVTNNAVGPGYAVFGFAISQAAVLTVTAAPNLPTVRTDFDADGRTEPLWRNTLSTQVTSWTTGSGFSVFGAESDGWAVIGAGDFDGDGKADVLWHNTSSGLVASWPSAGGFQVYGAEGGGWAVINTGDFDGDGKADVLWHNTTSGIVASWTTTAGFQVYGVEGGGWAVINTGDFDGDGKSDVLWHNTSNGFVASWTTGAGFQVYGVESDGWAVINTGDFDGDGKADVLWHNTSSGLVASWTTGAGFQVYGVEGDGWAVIQTGDFDGDGKTDVLWHNTTSGLVASWTTTAGYQVYGVEGGGWQVIRF